MKNPRGVELADVNGDGKVDLLITGYQANSFTIYVGDGNNGFRRVAAWFGFTVQPQGLAVADIDRDGHADVVEAADGTAGLAVFFGNGSPTVVGSALTKRLRPGASKLCSTWASGGNPISTRRSDSGASGERMRLRL